MNILLLKLIVDMVDDSTPLIWRVPTYKTVYANDMEKLKKLKKGLIGEFEEEKNWLYLKI